VGLAVGLFLGRVDGRELLGQAEVREDEIDQPVLRRRRDAEGEPVAAAQPDRIVDARLQHPPLDHQLADSVDHPDRHVLGRRSWPRKALVPIDGDLVDEHALGLAARLRVDRHAERSQDLDLGDLPQGFRVDEQPVHVEHGRDEPIVAHRIGAAEAGRERPGRNLRRGGWR
jgi:hypothetical protein